MIRRKHYIEVLKCTNCTPAENPNDTSVILKKAKAPEAFIPHYFCSPKLLAHTILKNTCRQYRFTVRRRGYAALEISLSKTTMANWIIRIAASKILPVWERMKSELLTNHVIHADETVVQVLHEKGRSAKMLSRMWVYCAPKVAGHVNILFEYTQTPSGENAVNFLGDFSGYLVCDGYDAYNRLRLAIRCGCFAHVKKKFVEALPTEKGFVTIFEAKRC